MLTVNHHDHMQLHSASYSKCFTSPFYTVLFSTTTVQFVVFIKVQSAVSGTPLWHTMILVIVFELLSSRLLHLRINWERMLKLQLLFLA